MLLLPDMKKILPKASTHTLQQDMNIAEYKMTVPNSKEGNFQFKCFQTLELRTMVILQ